MSTSPPSVSSRQAYDQWVADGRDEVARAKERMDALFAGRAERGRPLADDTLAELAAVCGVTPGHGPRARPLSDRRQADAITLAFIHLGGYTRLPGE